MSSHPIDRAFEAYNQECRLCSVYQMGVPPFRAPRLLLTTFLLTFNTSLITGLGPWERRAAWTF